MVVKNGSRVRIPVFPRNRANTLIFNKLDAKLDLKRDKIGTSSVPIFDSAISDSMLSGQEPESTTDCHWDSRCLYAISECSRLDGVRKFFLGSVFGGGESLSGVAAQVQ